MLGDPQFWVMVAFIIFVVAIFRPLKKNLSATLDNKINEIKERINQAEKIKNDMQQTLSEIKKRQNDVKDEILNIEKEAKEKTLIIEKNANEKLNEQILRRNELAKTKIDQMTRDANSEVKKLVIYNSINATMEILTKNLSQNKKQNLINQSIVELNSVLKN